MSTKRRTRGAALIVALASTVIVVGNAHAQDDGTNSEGDPSAEQASQAELDAAADAADGDGDGPGDAADSAPPDDGSNLNPDVDRSSIDIAVAAAAANDELEQAARDSMDVPLGDPIIPQRDPDRPDIADGSEPDPLANTAPEPQTAAERTDSAEVADVEDATAEAGTRSDIVFDEIGLARADLALTPQLALEIGSAERVRYVALDAADLTGALDASMVTMELFDDVTLQLATDLAPSAGALDSITYSAGGAQASELTDVDGATVESDMAVVTALDDRIVGQFWNDGAQYQILSVDDGLAAVIEVSRPFPDHELEERLMATEPGPDNGPSGLTAAEVGFDDADIIGLPAVEVLIAYDDEAQAFYGGLTAIRNNAAQMVNLTNQTYRNTDQQQHMNLVGLYDTDTVPNTTNGATYRNQLAAKADGNFDGVHAARDAAGADLVVLLSNRFVNTGLCGIAFFPTSANPAENDAYNVTEASCALTGLTFSHELGHNQCAGHDNLGSNLCGYADGRGFSDAGANRRTIMARNGTPGIRQPVWSKLGHVFEGWTHGDADHDNALVMEIEDLGGVSGGIANYRAGNGTTAAVAGIDGQSCIYGSLEQAFLLAPLNSTIFVAPGVHVGQDPTTNFNITDSIDVEQGTAQCEPTTGGAATNVVLQPHPSTTSDAVLEIVTASVRLERITVENGASPEGTVEVEAGSDLVLDGVVIRNGNNPADGGGLRVIGADSSAQMINNGQIVNNTALNGGGVYVQGGASFTIDDTDDVEGNTATSGGGIYAAGGSTLVTVRNDGDVLDNTASLDGGGVYLIDGADLTVSGQTSFVGVGGLGNAAQRGGGVFIAEGSTGSKAKVQFQGEVSGNSASFGAGVYLLNGELEVNNNGGITDNIGGNGGGILAVNDPNTTTTVDLNAGSRVGGNSGAIGAGVFMSTNSTLRADGNAGGSGVNPVSIDGNTSSASGGGIYLQSSKKTILDTLHLVGNSASISGGGIYNDSTAIDVIEDSNCDGGDLAKEQYCNEIADNSATNGGGIFSDSGTLDVSQTSFERNTATTGGQAVEVVGTASADMRALMIIGHDSSSTGDGSLVAKGTSDLDITAATIVNPGATQGAWFDLDDAATGRIDRIIATTSVLTGANAPTGTCNLHTDAAFGTPNAVTASPEFAPTANSDFVPSASSPAVDACVAQGSTVDILDRGVRNGDGLPSGTEYDMGAIEAPRGNGVECDGKQATIVGTNAADNIVGTNGADVVVARKGLDVIDTRDGDDTICAGRGNDEVDAGDGKDTVFGQGGRDQINGGRQSDKLFGQGGNDQIRAGKGNDRVEGLAGNDVLKGDRGADRLLGGPADDDLNGGPGSPDICNGQQGTDTGGGGCELINNIP